LPLSEIMHARSLQVPPLPVRVRQWLVLHDEPGNASRAAWLREVIGETVQPDLDRLEHRDKDRCLLWEAHTEFSTITVMSTGPSNRAPANQCDWLDAIPGHIFRSVEILVGGPQDFDWEAESNLDRSRLVSSMAFGGAAHIRSDFTIKQNGAGKILVEDLGLRNDEPSRLVQTLLEIGNYRKLALLGFPLARELMPWITAAEARHGVIAARMNSRATDRAEILGDLLSLSAEVEHQAGKARFRLDATNSYHLLTRDRLASLREERLQGYSTWAEFVERRLLPAMRTCEISRSRLDALSERINRSASLLSLEQNVELNKRSQASLASMNRRAMLQLRLQSLVEGLSIFAISYYIVSLFKHLLEPLGMLAGAPEIGSLIISGLVPSTLSIAWLVSSRRRGKLEKLVPLDA
jgi:uncharacterized membrane-anchored protein